ncbi:hypothetical protein Tco_0205950 [Tanacetum coccineum]
MPLFNEDDVYGWVYLAKRFFDIQGFVTFGERLKAVMMCLEGLTMSWFRWTDNREPFRSWEDLKRRMLVRFQSSQAGSIPINRGLIQAIPTSLPPQPIGEATKASNLKGIRSPRNMEDDVDISVLTMEQYIALIPDDIKPGIVIPKIGDDVEFEINANFMRELRRKNFAGTDDEDAYEHVCTNKWGPYRIRETVRMIGNPEEIHNAKAQEDERDMDVGWNITSKDRLRQFLTPTIHILPNLEPVVQPYIPLGPVHDKEKIVREKEQDYNIPLNNSVMQTFTHHSVRITPPDDNYVAPATNPMSNKQLNKFKEEFSNKVAKKENDNPVIMTYDCETFIRKLLHQDPAARKHLSRSARRIIMCQLERQFRLPTFEEFHLESIGDHTCFLYLIVQIRILPVPPAPAVQVLVVSAGTPFSTTIGLDAPSTSYSPSFSDVQPPVSQQGVAAGPNIEDNPFSQADNDPFVNVFALELSSEESSSGDVSSAKSTQVIKPYNHLGKWSKDHPLDNVIGNPSRLVSTRKYLATDALWCLYNSVLSKVEPKIFKTAMDEACWFKAMQEEIQKFDRL